MNELLFERTFRSWCADTGVEWQTLRYARPEASGVTQAHRLLPSGEPTGGVLVVHGAGNDALFSLTGLFAALLARRFEVFTFDVDGHGRRSDTRLSQESARSVVDAALAAWGPPERVPLHAIGISLGGSLLLYSLPALSSRVASAALICTPLRIELSWRTIGREVGMPMLRTLWRERSRFGLTGLIPSFGPFRRGLYPLRLAAEPGPGPFGYVAVLNDILAGLSLPSAARAATTPVLLVCGGRDLLVPVAQARRLGSLLKACELKILPRETHLSTPLDRVTSQHLLHWLARHQTADRHLA